MVDSANWITIARIIRPQGRRGELLAEILTDFPALFTERKRVYIGASGPEAREILLDSSWLHKGRVVLKFSGIDSISDAEALRGLAVLIPREERAALDEDSYYISDLQGCRIVDASSTPSVIGEVIDLDNTGPGVPLLVVSQPAGIEPLLIPFAKSYLRRISLAERIIEMDLPPGLLDINAPLTEEERRQAEAAPE